MASTGITLILRKGVGLRNVWWLSIAAIGKTQNNITIISYPTSASSSLCAVIQLAMLWALLQNQTCVQWSSYALAVHVPGENVKFNMSYSCNQNSYGAVSLSIRDICINTTSINTFTKIINYHTYSPPLCTLYKSNCAHIVITLIWLT